MGRALFAKLSLLLLIALASEKASFSPLASCSSLVEQIRESKRPELVLQQNSLGEIHTHTPPKKAEDHFVFVPIPIPKKQGLLARLYFLL